MTWVVAGNCFNGFICVADIQATIVSKNGKHEYYNCVQKIHKVAKNLCVAFSGDIRTGLKTVENIKVALSYDLSNDEYFDIDGQSKHVIDFFKKNYRTINPSSNPPIEFILMWNAQEGDEYIFRPFCMKFKSPEFNLNSTSLPGLAQSGSGISKKRFSAISAFLQGKKIESPEYEEIFSEIKEAPNIVTVKNFKNILLKESSRGDYPGISKSFISFESEVPYDRIYSEQTNKNIKEACITLGMGSTEIKTQNHSVFLSEISTTNIQEKIKRIKEINVFLYNSLMEIIVSAINSVDISPLAELPKITTDYYLSDEEEIHSYKLITTWDELKVFLSAKGVNVSAVQALA